MNPPVDRLMLSQARAEVAELRAALATATELVREGVEAKSWNTAWVAKGRAFLANQPAAPRIAWQCSMCKWGFAGKWQKKCPQCGIEDWWTGSVHPGAKLWTGQPAAPARTGCGKHAGWRSDCDDCAAPARTEAEPARKALDDCKAMLRELNPHVCTEAEQRVLPPFKEAWARKRREGYQYGRDALDQVRFGYEIAGAELARREDEHSREPARAEAEQRVLDALGAIPSDDIQLALDLRDGMSGAERRAWRAELARREAEK